MGVELANGGHRTRRSSFVEDVLETLTIEDYTLSTARAHGHLLAFARSSGTPRGAHDLMIAATAVAADRILVAADARGFADLPGLDVRVL